MLGIAQTERLHPIVVHTRIAANDALAGYTGRRSAQCSGAIEDDAALLARGTRKQAQQRVEIACACLPQNYAESLFTAIGIQFVEIKLAQCGLELRRVVHARKPEGYSQPLAYHPDVRRHVAEISADLEAARLITYRSAWLSDTQGPTPETTAALYRAKYVVGEAVSRITRTALTLGGAHGIFKTSRLEQLFRDGALGPLHPPPSDFCLYNIGLYELGLDPADLLPPLKPG